MLTIKKNGNKAWVTFTFSPTNVVENVAILGEWNQWKEEPMKKKKNGDYYITKVLTSGNSFQFGYKVNGNDWVREEQCASVPSPFTSQNSLLTL
ncbi:hypothetical protein KKC13_02825 [bacterium]|nr:hypothetical protein [bacterium]MBU1957177.1 hypothetical protein [bacterium]